MRMATMPTRTCAQMTLRPDISTLFSILIEFYFRFVFEISGKFESKEIPICPTFNNMCYKIYEIKCSCPSEICHKVTELDNLHLSSLVCFHRRQLK